MSTRTKKKYVIKEVLEEFPEPEGDQRIVQVQRGCGNNLHRVFDPKGIDGEQTYLVSMPKKYRRTIWVRRNNFIIVQPIAEGDKVKAEIAQILYEKQIQHLKKGGLWPPFPSQEPEDESSESASDDDDDSDLFVNTNRVPVLDDGSSSSSSSSSSEGEDDDKDNGGEEAKSSENDGCEKNC